MRTLGILRPLSTHRWTFSCFSQTRRHKYYLFLNRLPVDQKLPIPTCLCLHGPHQVGQHITSQITTSRPIPRAKGPPPRPPARGRKITYARLGLSFALSRLWISICNLPLFPLAICICHLPLTLVLVHSWQLAGIN